MIKQPQDPCELILSHISWLLTNFQDAIDNALQIGDVGIPVGILILDCILQATDGIHNLAVYGIAIGNDAGMGFDYGVDLENRAIHIFIFYRDNKFKK